MITSLQKLLVRPQRYRIGFRLGFYFYLLYVSQTKSLFDLFVRETTFSFSSFTIFFFCDFFSKELFLLLESYVLGFFQQSTAFGFRQPRSESLQIFCNRVPKLLVQKNLLPKTAVCLVSTSLTLFLNCFYFLLSQKRSDLQFKYFWISSFCTVVKPKKSFLQCMTKINYLQFFSFLQEAVGGLCYSFSNWFLVFSCVFLKLCYSFLFYFIFLFRSKFLV